MITLFLKKLTQSLHSYKPYTEIIQLLANRVFPFEVEGPKGAFLGLLLAELHNYTQGPALVVVPTEREAKELADDIALATPHVSYFPWIELIPYQGAIPQALVLGQRVWNLVKLLQNEKILLITTLRGLLFPVAHKDFIRSKLLKLASGDKLDPERLRYTLSELDYNRVPRVSVIGEFALRGEVLDIFLPGDEEAIRVVFEFDTIEEIKRFNPITQDSTEKLESVTIYPAREILWTDECISALSSYFQTLIPDKGKEAEDLIEELKRRRTCRDEELFHTLCFPDRGSLLDYLPTESVVFFIDYERLVAGAEIIQKEYRELFTQRKDRRKIDPAPEKVLFEFQVLAGRKKNKVIFPTIRNSTPTFPVKTIICEGPRSFFGNMVYLKEELSHLVKSGYSISIFAESESQALRIEHLLKDFPLQVIPQHISGGFSVPDLKIMAIQENEIFGRRKRVPQSVRKAKSRVIDTFVDLSPGDLVVHINYGIGKFKGIDRIKAAGTERDYIQVEYADEETIFIPIEQVNLIQRYIGSEGATPRLDKIGGKAWENRKRKVTKSVEDLAERLIKLYSRRKTVQGFAFPPDTDWQLEFEATFPYEETADQIRCIEEVKADMEKSRPMDRLICGDVGYGKTEIAMRAAFKAVVSGKQAVFLAPTTILAEQHYENFKERFERFPVRMGMLSRFVSRGEQKKLGHGLAAGDVDLIIGTHRILQKDIHFKNLGLIIIDEEQRFGVKDKERLKELKTSVDCLALSATPIPRTLHMSLLKIRDMSLLTTPPQNRLPIETFIQEFDEAIVADAIRREVQRGGQVFYLHNRIETLDNVKLFLQKLVPEVLVECAHGKMSAYELEDIMHRFVHGGFHVLISTTIIENGIDIPNVNTIIIDRADIYGISQLYQLKGRVGRSDIPASAYLLYPEERVLSELAMKRLKIISDFTDLGSGFKIALKDLEVRGAGNLLGREQHGDILAVGFDLYIRLLEEAIAELSEEKEEKPPEVYLELEYSGFIPDTYISDQTEKMEVYKKIAAITTEEELDRVFSELQDRFGPLPVEVLSLLSLAEIRILCGKLFISSLKERKGTLEVEFGKVSIISVDKLLNLIKNSGGKVQLDPHRPHVLIMKTDLIGLSEKSEFIRDRLSALL
ncbi:MAG: transcription-repair coupling factor [Spirochaetota bacterium]